VTAAATAAVSGSCTPASGQGPVPRVWWLAGVAVMRTVFVCMFAEKYLREVWPAVTRALRVGVGCELNLVEGSMSGAHHPARPGTLMSSSAGSHQAAGQERAGTTGVHPGAGLERV